MITIIIYNYNALSVILKGIIRLIEIKDDDNEITLISKNGSQ